MSPIPWEQARPARRRPVRFLPILASMVCPTVLAAIAGIAVPAHAVASADGLLPPLPLPTLTLPKLPPLPTLPVPTPPPPVRPPVTAVTPAPTATQSPAASPTRAPSSAQPRAIAVGPEPGAGGGIVGGAGAVTGIPRGTLVSALTWLRGASVGVIIAALILTGLALRRRAT